MNAGRDEVSSTSTESREYVVLLHGDERVWESADAAGRAAAYAEHGEFTRLCEERGHEITGGAELASSTAGIVVRRPRPGDRPLVTEGPFTETVEQLGGFYVIRTTDVEDLADLVAMLVDETGTAEIRPVVSDDDRAAESESVDRSATASAGTAAGTGASS